MLQCSYSPPTSGFHPTLPMSSAAEAPLDKTRFWYQLAHSPTGTPHFSWKINDALFYLSIISYPSKHPRLIPIMFQNYACPVSVPPKMPNTGWSADIPIGQSFSPTSKASLPYTRRSSSSTHACLLPCDWDWSQLLAQLPCTQRSWMKFSHPSKPPYNLRLIWVGTNSTMGNSLMTGQWQSMRSIHTLPLQANKF